MLRVVRLRRRTPRACSIRVTHLLTTDVDTLSRRAAPEKLRASTTRAKISIPARSMIASREKTPTILFQIATESDRTPPLFPHRSLREMGATRPIRRESGDFSICRSRPTAVDAKRANDFHRKQAEASQGSARPIRRDDRAASFHPEGVGRFGRDARAVRLFHAGRIHVGRSEEHT